MIKKLLLICLVNPLMIRAMDPDLHRENAAAILANLSEKKNELNESNVQRKKLKLDEESNQLMATNVNPSDELIEHIEVAPSNASYKCPIDSCTYQCQLSQELTRHLKEHPVIKEGVMVFCAVCSKKMHTTSYGTHLQDHSGEEKLKCPNCPEIFYRVSSLTNHIASKHPSRSLDIEKVRCPICTLCEKNCGDVDILYDHTMEEHVKIPKQCPLCKRDFKRPAHLRDHLKNFHFDIRRYSCENCKRAFGRESSLEQHKELCLKKTPNDTSAHDAYCCEHCKETRFSTKDALKRHLKRFHPNTAQPNFVDQGNEEARNCSRAFVEWVEEINSLSFEDKLNFLLGLTADYPENVQENSSN